MDKLQHLFPENEVKRILHLHVGNAPDRDIWVCSSHGSYTVKSGYEVASKMKETLVAQYRSVQPGVLELKRNIWKVPTIPKIRNFLWRAASGALAVAERLNTRGMNLDSRCNLCSNEVQSIDHVLFKCRTAQEAWMAAGFQPLPNFCSLSHVELLSSYLRLMPSESIPETKRRSISWIIWVIWKNWNMILYADIQESITFQIQQACEKARLWNEINTERRIPTVEQRLSGDKKRWEMPISGHAKCNIHANWRSAKLHSGVAYIVRDNRGNVLHHARDVITFSPNRFTAEIRCLAWALHSMKDQW